MSGGILPEAHGDPLEPVPMSGDVLLAHTGDPAEGNAAFREHRRGPVQVVPKTSPGPGHGPASPRRDGTDADPRTAQAASRRRESSTRTCCGASIVRTMSRPLYDCTSKNWRT